MQTWAPSGRLRLGESDRARKRAWPELINIRKSVPGQVVDRLHHRAFTDLSFLQGKTDEKRIVAEGVDGFWGSRGKLARRPSGPLAEEGSRILPDNFQAVLDVLVGLLFIERKDVSPEIDALSELPKIRPPQLFLELGLPGEDDLEQLVFSGFKVGEKPQVFQAPAVQVLGLVHHDHHVSAGRELFNGKFVEAMDGFRLGQALFFGRKPQILEDHLKHLLEGDVRVEDVGHLHVLSNAIEGGPEQRGLPGAGFADHDDKPPSLPDPVDEGGEDFPVRRAQVEELRVGRDVKGLFGKFVEFAVHIKS
jgi:hypothetical protein